MSASNKQALRQRLGRYRLDRGWSFQQLSEAIAVATGVRVSPPTIIRFIENETETLETKVDAIRRYLEREKAA